MRKANAYKATVIVLLVTMLLQVSPFSYRHAVFASYEPDLSGFDLGSLDALMSLYQESGQLTTRPEAAPRAADCNVLYLPLIVKSFDGAAVVATASEPRTASNALTGPDFEIIQPNEGWTISGMSFFAVQPFDPSQVSQVSFKAGSTDLGTDTTSEDGFRVFLDASTLPDGPIELTATATNPCGETTETVNVNVVANPPQSATVGKEGGVLASEIGSLLLLPPGTVPDGTVISVTEKTQAQLTSENGIDWDTLGVTFLGTQDVQSSAAFSQPVAVTAAGFGPRVQPGQAVLNYQLIPDADGDGIDELVVLNTASVAPNDDIISDPVPQAQVGIIETQSKSNGFSRRTAQAGINGTAGTMVDLETNGFNPLSINGNVAIWTSLVDGQTFEIPGLVLPDASNASIQIFSTMIPPLPPGGAQLTLINKSTGSSATPIAVTIETPLSPSKSTTEIFDEFLRDTINYFDTLPSFSDEQDEAIDITVDGFTQIRTEFQQLVNTGLLPGDEIILNNIAVTLENSAIYNVEARDYKSTDTFLDDVLGALAGITGVILGAAAITLSSPVWVTWAGIAGVIIGVATTALFICKLFSNGQCFDDPEPGKADSADCFPSHNANRTSDPGRVVIGVGGAAPAGGTGCGNIIGETANAVVRNKQDDLKQEPNSIVVKVFINNISGSFAAVPDAGGYFFIPGIAQGESFTARAIDTLTGETWSTTGIGPAFGDSVFLFFDLSETGTLPNSVSWDGGGDGSSWNDPLNWNTDQLPGITNTVTIDMPGNITVTHSANTQTNILGLQSEEAIVVSGGVLDISGQSTINNALTVEGGQFNGSGDVTVNGPMVWTNFGVLIGTGRVIANGGLEISGSSAKNFGRIIENNGSGVWLDQGGISQVPLNLGPAGAIYNLPGATFEIKNDASSNVTFHNEGALIKSVGTGTTLMAVTFYNTGTVELQSGTFEIGGFTGIGGSSSGTFNLNSNTMLKIGTNHTLTTSSIVTGAGTVEFNGAPQSNGDVNGTYNVSGGTIVSGGTTNFTQGAVISNIGDSLIVSNSTVNFDSGDPLNTSTLILSSGGILAGSSDITVTNTISWTGGTMSGSGQTISNGSLEIAQPPGSGGKTLNERQLINNGAATYSGDIAILGLNGGIIINRVGATFDITNDGDLNFNSGDQPRFINEGTFTKSGGTGVTSIQFDFDNSGTVELQSGNLNINFVTTDYIQTAGITTLNGGSLTVSGGADFDVEGGELSGVGTITGDIVNTGGQVNPGDVGASGVLTITGDYTQALTGTLAIELGGLNPGTEHDQLIVGGNATLDGTLNVSTINAFTPSSGNSFQIMTYGTHSGTFSTIDGQGITYTPTYSTTDLMLEVP